MNLRNISLVLMIASLGISSAASGMFLVPAAGLAYNGYYLGKLGYQQKCNRDIRARFAPVQAGLNEVSDDFGQPSTDQMNEWGSTIKDLEKNYPYLNDPARVKVGQGVTSDSRYRTFRASFNTLNRVNSDQIQSAQNEKVKAEEFAKAHRKSNAFIQSKKENYDARWWSIAYRGALTAAFAGLTGWAIFDALKK